MGNITLPFEWGTSVVWISVFTGVLVAVACAVMIYRYVTAHPFKPLSGSLIGVVVCLAVVLFLLQGVPTSLTYGSDGIKIGAIFGGTEIARSEITSVSVISEADLGDVERVNGSGGAGGYIGHFRSQTIGDYESYVTDRSLPLLLVDTPRGKYVISTSQAREIAAAMK